MATISKILFPADFSDRSLAALPLAMDLAHRYGAELHCLHVVDTESEFFVEGGYIVPLMMEYPLDHGKLKEAAESHLDQFVARHMPGREDSLKKAVVMGKPFAEIIRYAREQGIDLIVLGTHGYSALGSMLLGSVAEKVVRKAPCAVLTVRHPEQRFEAP
jgi:nucleotide-binding universal stress UspA family protein